MKDESQETVIIPKKKRIPRKLPDDVIIVDELIIIN